MSKKIEKAEAPIKVIVKLENDGKKTPILFFPEQKANPANIPYWTSAEGHGEASLSYFWALRNPEPEVAEAFIKQYERLHNCTLTRVARDTYQMRMARWAA